MSTDTIQVGQRWADLDMRNAQQGKKSGKVLALRSATEWARSFVNAAPSPERVVEAAKKFEQYLKGDNK